MKKLIVLIITLAPFFAKVGGQITSYGNASTQFQPCLNKTHANTTGTWKAVGPNGMKVKSTYWDGARVGICTDNPQYPLDVNSEAKINSLIVGNIDGQRKGASLSIVAHESLKMGSQVVLYSNSDPAGYGRIDFNSGNGNSNKGYGFVFSNWDGNKYNLQMIIRKNGKISMGDVKNVNGNYKLYVEKGILTERLKLALNGSSKWADFVFEDDYNLPPLDSVEVFIKTNKHLPDIPSEKEIKEKGLDVAEMDALLLQKIEELTLYVIDQNKKIEKLEQENNRLKHFLFETDENQKNSNTHEENH